MRTIERRWHVKTYEEIARFFGVKQKATIRRWRQQGMPGRSGRYNLSAIVQWLRREGPWSKANHHATKTPDPLLTGDEDSPALEDYRRAQAELAKLKLEERRRNLLDRREVHDLLGRAAAIIRTAGEQLDRQFGPEAHSLLDDALADVQREFQTLEKQ